MKFFGTLFVLFILLVGFAFWMVTTPYGPHGETFVDIAPHTSTGAIGETLEQKGVIRSRYGFEQIGRAHV